MPEAHIVLRPAIRKAAHTGSKYEEIALDAIVVRAHNSQDMLMHYLAHVFEIFLREGLVPVDIGQRLDRDQDQERVVLPIAEDLLIDHIVKVRISLNPNIAGLPHDIGELRVMPELDVNLDHVHEAHTAETLRLWIAQVRT